MRSSANMPTTSPHLLASRPHDSSTSSAMSQTLLPNTTPKAHSPSPSESLFALPSLHYKGDHPTKRIHLTATRLESPPQVRETPSAFHPHAQRNASRRRDARQQRRSINGLSTMDSRLCSRWMFILRIEKSCELSHACRR